LKNLNDITNNLADQDKGREFELADPFSGELTGIKLHIVGPDSETARRADLAFADELADMANEDGRVNAEQRRKARMNALARRVIRWEAEEDSKSVPFNTKNLLTLLAVPWVDEQVDAFAGDRRNFAPEAE